jgi:hypothetical protein
MGMMAEEELSVVRQVCQRWWVLAQDPPLFRPQVYPRTTHFSQPTTTRPDTIRIRRQALGAAREDLRAAMVRAEEQLVTLTGAIVAGTRMRPRWTSAVAGWKRRARL